MGENGIPRDDQRLHTATPRAAAERGQPARPCRVSWLGNHEHGDIVIDRCRGPFGRTIADRFDAVRRLRVGYMEFVWVQGPPVFRCVAVRRRVGRETRCDGGQDNPRPAYWDAEEKPTRLRSATGSHVNGRTHPAPVDPDGRWHTGWWSMPPHPRGDGADKDATTREIHHMGVTWP